MTTQPINVEYFSPVRKTHRQTDHVAIPSFPSRAAPLPSIRDLLHRRQWARLDAQPRELPVTWPTIAPNVTRVLTPQKMKAKTDTQRQAGSQRAAQRSLWKCRRRPLSIQDLLCSEEAQSNQREQKPHTSHRRQCGATQCFKYALSGGFCISHGGGKLCRHEGCTTVAQSGGLCKAHGGGSKCKAPGCTSVARRKGFCMVHGGRQSCKLEGCNKCAHGGGFCIAHGGGKRCSTLGCTKSAQAGGFCYSHGGGKRCAAPQCFQAARKGGRCIRHRSVSPYGARAPQ